MVRWIVLAVLHAATAEARPRRAPASVPVVPSIDDVVAAEGFVPTPSQSEIYRPGSVLVPNGRGGHDVVLEGCVDADPSVSVLSQSSIATTLAGGVSARLGVLRGAAEARIEKRLSFVDPEQRTLPLAQLTPTQACVSGVQTAHALRDLSDAIVVHDVLVAIFKNTVCTQADASGGVVALGAVEAAAFSECVKESDGQVPLGFKAVSLSKVLALVQPPVVLASPESTAEAVPPSAPARAALPVLAPTPVASPAVAAPPAVVAPPAVAAPQGGTAPRYNRWYFCDEHYIDKRGRGRDHRTWVMRFRPDGSGLQLPDKHRQRYEADPGRYADDWHHIQLLEGGRGYSYGRAEWLGSVTEEEIRVRVALVGVAIERRCGLR